jgi:hypothetical protein
VLVWVQPVMAMVAANRTATMVRTGRMGLPYFPAGCCGQSPNSTPLML